MISGLIQRSWSLRAIGTNLHTGIPRCSEKTKKRGYWPWSKNDDDEDKIKIIQPRKCLETGIPILDPECKVAVVFGGAADIGLSAADSLLYHGARAVVLVDEDSQAGENAARSLCDFHGKNRAQFFRCGLSSNFPFEGIFDETICRYKTIDVLFSNLDRNSSTVGLVNSSCKGTESQWQQSNTLKAIHTGIQYMGKISGGSGGIIVNAASILGFMGWPTDPTPVYRFKEPVVETTMDLAKMYPVEKTGVRIVALLRSDKPLAEVGLPYEPSRSEKISERISRPCEPSAESRIGKALVHVMARAKTGTTWLTEPAPCLRETPWLIHFPVAEGETVDPRVYDHPV